MDADNKDDYYDILEKMEDFENNIVIHGKSKDGEIATIVETKSIDMDEESTISVTKKKKKKKPEEESK